MRLYRLLAITMIMINKDKVTAKELAEQFEVSQRTIYRDLDTINQAGIPLVSYQGSDGGYAIMENYKMDKNMFTPEEILSIMTALEGLNSTMEDRSLKDITEKFKTLIPEKNSSDFSKKLAIDLNPWDENEEIRDKIDILKKAIDEKKIIKIKYINRQIKTSTREIEPITLVLKGTTWYLYAYCNLRSDYRIFRLSRIQECEVLNRNYNTTHKNYREFEKQHNWESQKNLVDLELSFNKEIYLNIQDYFSSQHIKKQEDGSIHKFYHMMVTMYYPYMKM